MQSTSQKKASCSEYTRKSGVPSLHVPLSAYQDCGPLPSFLQPRAWERRGNERGRGLYLQTVLAVLPASGEILGCAMQEPGCRARQPHRVNAGTNAAGVCSGRTGEHQRRVGSRLICAGAVRSWPSPRCPPLGCACQPWQSCSFDPGPARIWLGFRCYRSAPKLRYRCKVVASGSDALVEQASSDALVEQASDEP